VPSHLADPHLEGKEGGEEKEEQRLTEKHQLKSINAG